jgi:cytochrome P450
LQQATLTPPSVNSGFLGLRTLREVQADVLTFMTKIRQQGDVVRFSLGPKTAWLISDPALVQTIVMDQVEKFPRPKTVKHVLGKMIGKGILLTDGPYWLSQRRLVQPAFHHKRIENYAQSMVEMTQRLLTRWQDGAQREITADMQRLTLNIVSKTLFNTEDETFADRIHEVATFLQAGVARRLRTGIDLDWLPTSDNRAYRAGLNTLDEIIRSVIQERRRSDVDHGDLLSMLLAATDEQGNKMNDQQVRDEAITLFLAGHDTTSLLLSWAFYLLAKHPDVVRTLEAELDSALQGHAPTLADLPNLPYTEKIVKETLRLYPSAYFTSREAAEDVTLGGYHMRKGTQVFMLSYLLHRDARWFEQPEVFNPDRFTEGFEKSLPRCAYMPFLTGPHICIGNSFALMEAKLVLATICQQWRLEMVRDEVIKPKGYITLYLGSPLEMRLHKR